MITVTRDTKSKKANPKSDFLAPNQRKELQKLLIEKYTKTYGLSCPGAVSEEVNRFFASNVPVNGKTLSQLETCVKRRTIQLKSVAKPPKAADLPVVTLSYARQNSEPLYDETFEQGNCQNYTKNSPKEHDEEKEDDEWDTVGTYQAYILKQEKELEKKKKQLEQKAVRVQLDHQLKEKQKNDKLLREEHNSYVKNEETQLSAYNSHNDKINRLRDEEKKQLFDMQTKMIQERNAQLNKEKQIQDEIDKRIMESIEHDLVKQKQLQLARNEEKRQEMVRVREENEGRKLLKKQQAEKDRLEQIELQKMADRLAQDLEEQRAAELKAKADKIQQMIIVGEKVVKNQREKNLEEERRIKDYNERKNRALDRKDLAIQRLEKENKNRYTEFLDQQVAEKNKKLQGEKDYLKEQAEIWKQENDFYANKKGEQSKNNAKNLKDYTDQLDIQIKDREEKERRVKGTTMPDEEKMKTILMEQIRNLDVQNRILNEQLRT